uniref:U5 small nuclear ribonucleoprotein TSSC4 n=2 Tax=Oryza brachyantha TaxID=4533 RepID=J3LXE0_ORYBR
MNEIMDDGMNMSINTVVPDILDDSIEEIHRFSRDPRADLSAASARLKEYDSSANDGPCAPPETKECPTGGIQAMKTEDTNVRPILKRKEEQGDSKPRKRVKFASDVKDQSAELPEQDEDSPMVPQSMDLVIGKDSSTPSMSPGVPDYVKNPTKYTRYTLDAPECNDDSNKRAFAGLHDLLRRMEPEPEAPVEIPSSVMFIPRKKSVDVMTVDEGPKSSDSNSSLIGLAAGASDETEQCEMDEDDPKASPTPQVQTNTKVNSRRYRSSRTDDE